MSCQETQNSTRNINIYEPVRAIPIGFQVQRLNHSAKDGAKGTARGGGKKWNERGERGKEKKWKEKGGKGENT